MTGGLPIDVVQFIERRYAPDNFAAIFELLDSEVLSTPRVMRAVLYLADGSLSLLRHYVTECAEDVGDVLMRAEYVVGVADEPMAVRDMSQPFSRDENLGPGWKQAKAAGISGAPRRGPRRSIESDGLNYHQYLASRRFALGSAEYLVALAQPHPDYVRCYRKQGNVSQVVRLPLVFVLERFAEHIEIAENRPSDFISSVR
jgi:hypothetical protein